MRRVGSLTLAALVSMAITLFSLTFDRGLTRSAGGGLEASFGLPLVFATSTPAVPPDGPDLVFDPWENPTTFDWPRFGVAWAVFAVGVVFAWFGLSAFWRRVGSAAT